MDYTFSDKPRFPPELQKIADEACTFVKSNAETIIDRFAGDEYPKTDNPISIFMAGSPGAGKTEFSKTVIKKWDEPIVRIDGDEIRELLPGYDGHNSYLFQHAISIGVDKLHDHVLAKNKNFILDGTFSDFTKAHTNVQRSIKRDRPVIIIYIYQDPIIAWKFTQIREAAEGRSIPRGLFINAVFTSKQVVQKIKDEFGRLVEVWLIQKNLEKETEKAVLNIDKIDSHLRFPYSKDYLEENLPYV